MKVYNVGTPIAYTGLQRAATTTARQTIETIGKEGQEILNELAEETLHLLGKDDATLNYMYKHLAVGTERKLEHFTGLRKISVFRGDGYMNKITQRLNSDPPLTFIRNMQNFGTNENPKLKTTAVSLRIPGRPENIFIEFLNKADSENKLFLRITREGFEAHRALYKSWHDLLENDVVFPKVLSTMTGKPFDVPIRKP